MNMIYLAEGGNAYMGQILFDPQHTGLLAKGHDFLSFIPQINDSDSVKKYSLSDFKLMGLPIEIFLAKDSDKDILNPKKYSDVNGFSEYLAKGDVPFINGTDASIIFLKDTLKGKVIDNVLKEALHETDDVLVDFPYTINQILKMSRIPVKRIEKGL